MYTLHQNMLPYAICSTTLYELKLDCMKYQKMRNIGRYDTDLHDFLIWYWIVLNFTGNNWSNLNGCLRTLYFTGTLFAFKINLMYQVAFLKVHNMVYSGLTKFDFLFVWIQSKWTNRVLFVSSLSIRLMQAYT